MKVLIKSISDDTNPYMSSSEEFTEVYVDGELIGRGFYGGEIEDNCRYHQYDWVEKLLVSLAEKLGANVEFVEEHLKDTNE